MNRAKTLVAFLAIALLAAVLPPGIADAKRGATTLAQHVSVDTFYQWTVTADTASGDVVLTRFNPAADPGDDPSQIWETVGTLSDAAQAGASVAVGRYTDRNNPMIVLGLPQSERIDVWQYIEGQGLSQIVSIDHPEGTGVGSLFGASVDVSQGNIVVGAPGVQLDTLPGSDGAAYSFDTNDANFPGTIDSVTNALPAPPLDDGAEFGSVVQVEGNQAWVSAPGQSGAGAVIGFDISNNALSKTFVPDDPTGVSRFGQSLSTDPDRLLIGGDGMDRVYLQVSDVQTEIFVGQTIVDVALEGNLLALALDTGAPEGDAETVAVWSDNGGGGFTSFTSVSGGDIQEIVLGSGWLHNGVAGVNPLQSTHMNDTTSADKFVPQLGWQNTQFGNRVDIDGDTMVSVRGNASGNNADQLVISVRDNAGWSDSGWSARQFIDLPAWAASGVAVQGDVIAVTLNDVGTPLNPHVAVLQRADATSPFAITSTFRSADGTDPRGIAISDDGTLLALGLPANGVVEVFDGGPDTWSTATPTTLFPQDGSSPVATYGWDVDFGDNLLMVGQPNSASLIPLAPAGLADVWKHDQGIFTFAQTDQPPNSAGSDRAGWTVEVEEGVRAIGSPGVGTVHVWRDVDGDQTLTDPSPAGTNGYWGYAMDLDSGVLAVSDWTGDTVTYDVYDSTVTQTATFLATDAEPDDFSNSTFPLATSNGTVVLGARAEDFQGKDAGAAYFFSTTTSTPPAAPRTWPTVVDMDNGTAVVGNPAEDIVHVLRNTGAGWTETQQLVGVADTSFGAGVALDGDILIVGSPDHADGSGLINRYDYNPTTGFFTASASFSTNPAPPAIALTDGFGSQIDISREWIAVGAPVDGGAGSAVVYPLSFTTSDATIISAPDVGGAPAVGFGEAVGTGSSDSEEFVWVGAPGQDTGLVFGYAFDFDTLTWDLIESVGGANTGARYGARIDVDGFLTAIAADGPTDNYELVRWNSQQADRNGFQTTDVGDISLNSEILVLGQSTSGDLSLQTTNGQFTFGEFATGGTTDGGSVAVDGDWVIATNVVTPGTDWTQLATFTQISSVGTVSNTPANKAIPQFGSADGNYGSVVAGNDDVYVVAAPVDLNNGIPGQITVHDATTGAVLQTIDRTELIAPDGGFRDLALSDDRLVIVGARESGGIETVEIADWTGTAFSLPGETIELGAAESAAIDGDRLVLGLPAQDQALVYEYDAVQGWTQTATLVPDAINFDAAFGADVDLVDDVIVVGTDEPTDGGYVTAFSLDPADGWVENSTRLYGSQLVLGDRDGVGTAIAFDGDWLIVGAKDEDQNGGFALFPSPGVVYPFQHQGDGNFTAFPLIDPSNDIGGDNGDAAWGTSVDVRNGVLVAGGPGWENPANSAKSGAAVSYRWNFTDSTWEYNPFSEATNAPADGEFDDFFGSAIALAGDPLQPMTTIIGAPGEDVAGRDAGAFYTLTAPEQVIPAGPANRLLANDTSSNGFGRHIDIDGTVAVITEHDGGAAEVYDLVGTTWVFRQRLDDIADSIRDVSLDGNRFVVIDRIGNELMQFEETGGTFSQVGTRSFGGSGVPESVVLDGDDIFIGLPNSLNQEPLKHELWAGGNVAVPTLTDDAIGHQTGWSIAKDGDLVFVGAPRWDTSPAADDNVGRVYIYDTSTSSWTGTIEADQPGTLFGSDLAVSNGRLVVGYFGGVGPVNGGPTTAPTGLVEVYTDLTATGATLEQVLRGSDQDTADGFGAKVDISGDVIAVGAPAGSYNGVRRGEVITFTYNGTEWIEADTFRSNADSTGTDQFGHDVAIDDLNVIAGAFQHDNVRGVDAGAAYTYVASEPVVPEPDGKLISEPGSDIAGGEEFDNFGTAMDSDGTRLVIGAPENITPISGTDGGVYVFNQGANGWQFEQFIQNPSGFTTEDFGTAVAVEGDTLVVGAPFRNGATGSAWVIDLSGNNAPVELTPPSSLSGNALYGSAVDIDNGTIAVGAPGIVGAAANVGVSRLVLWSQSGSSWTQVGGLALPNSDTWRAGSSVSIDGDIAALGLPGDNRAIVIRQSSPGVWSPVVTKTFTGNASFGDAVAVQTDSVLGDVLVVGAPESDEATLFTYDDTDGWDSGQVLDAPPAVSATLGFGDSVAIDGTIAAVGASEGQTLEVFENSSYRVWTPLTSFSAPDAEAEDLFGATAVVAGSSVVAGAPLDDNNNGFDAGAAYEFAVTPPTPPDPPVVGFDPTFIAAISYDLPTSVMPGATTVTIEGASEASTSATATAAGIVAASIGAIDLSAPEAANNQLGDITFAELGIDVNGVGLDALGQVPLSEFPVDGGWAQYLPAAYDGVPLQAITLAEIWDTPSVQSIPLRFSDIEASPLRFSDIAAIGFGSVEVLDIDLDGDDSTAPFDEWCAALDAQGTSCADLGITDSSSQVTLGSVSAAGVNVEATPLRFSPLRFSYIEASPLRFSPLRFSDIQASPLRFSPLRFSEIESAPLRFSPLRFSPLRFSPLRFSPLRFSPLRFSPLRFSDINATPLRFSPLRFSANPNAIADCAIVDCNDPNLTLGDVALAGALLDGFTLDDLGDAIIGDYRVDDLLPGLTQDSIDGLQAEIDAGVTFEDLLNEVGIDGLGEMTLGDLDPAIWESITFTIGDFFEGYDEEELANYNIADFLLLFIPRDAYEWDDVDLSSINLQLAGMQAALPASITFTTGDGPPVDDVTIVIDIPDGAIVQSGGFSLAPTGASIGSVEVTDTTATIEVINVASGEEQTLTFGLFQGLDLGTETSTASASVNASSLASSDTISVVEAFEPDNNTLAGAIPVVSNNLYISHLGGSGDTDFYRLTVTEPSTSVSVQLANLAADFDLVVYGPRLTSILPSEGGGSAASAPTTDFDASGSGGVLSPVPLQDLPTSLDELQVYGASYFRGTQAEQVDFLATEVADYYVQVTGYLGASSPQPYSLRAATTATTELACPARTFQFPAGTPGTNTTAGGADTLILMNRSRLEALFGPTDAAATVAAVNSMIATAAGNGISATVIDVDAFAGVQTAYDAWDASPCSTIAVNNVVSEISTAVLGIRNVSSIDNLLIIGGDDVIPFGRVKDATTIANEQSYTNTFTAAENNALRQAFAGSWVLTDDPYADTAPIAIDNTDRVVYVPEIAMGRLVETPTEINDALGNYVTFNGQLDPTTGFVAGYDFLDDGTELTGDNLDEVISPSTVQRLINETWTANDLDVGLSAEPDIALVSAHFDHFNALPAAGSAAGDTSDLFSVGDVTDASPIDFSGSVLFSVGCHSGLSVSDLLVAPTGVVATDWAQTFLGNGAAAYVGNTGYGYGDDTAVALSEKLMAQFAAGLGDYDTIGEALLYAKQDYAADLTVYGAFDEKALMEATLYGIPFYTLGNTVVPEVVPDPPTETGETGGETYTDSFDPILEVEGEGTEDEVWSTNPGPDEENLVQVTSGYPILPRFEWEVTQQDPNDPSMLELDARGVVLESLVTVDKIDVDPATARAVYDLAASEPNTDASDVTFALSPAVNTYLTPEGIRQDVSMAVGAFQTSDTSGNGTMRLFENFDATVYYSDDPDAERDRPVITSVQASPSATGFDLAVTVNDASPVSRVAALVSSTPVPHAPTTWQLVEFDLAGGNIWSGSGAVAGTDLQWLIMAVDTHGNAAWSMSKELAFDGDGTSADPGPVLFNPTVTPDDVPTGEATDFAVDLWDFEGPTGDLDVVWDFGDGTTCTPGVDGGCDLVAPTAAEPLGSTTASHTYDAPGTYQVTVTATDGDGQTASFEVGSVTVVEVAVEGRARVIGLAPAGIGADDNLPGFVSNPWIWMNLKADNIDDLTIDRLAFNMWGGVRFRGRTIDSFEIDGDVATLSGKGRLRTSWWSRYSTVRYEITVDDSANTVVVRLWRRGNNPATTDPQYQITSEFGYPWTVRVTTN